MWQRLQKYKGDSNENWVVEFPAWRIQNVFYNDKHQMLGAIFILSKGKEVGWWYS
jgi:hypothetical protein